MKILIRSKLAFLQNTHALCMIRVVNVPHQGRQKPNITISVLDAYKHDLDDMLDSVHGTGNFSLTNEERQRWTQNSIIRLTIDASNHVDLLSAGVDGYLSYSQQTAWESRKATGAWPDYPWQTFRPNPYPDEFTIAVVPNEMGATEMAWRCLVRCGTIEGILRMTPSPTITPCPF